MRTFGRWITDWLIARRMPLLVLGLAAAAVAYFPSRRLVFDRSIENTFGPGDPLLPPYERLKRTFGGNEVVLAVYVDDELFDPDGRGMHRLSRLRHEVEALRGVKAVVSIDQPLGHRIVDEDSPLAGRLRKLFEGYTHGADGRTAAVVCMLVPESETDVPREKLIEQLRRIVRKQPSGMLTGEPVLMADGFRYVQQDGVRLSWISTVLLAATIVLCFRSLRWVIVPIAVVQLTLLLTQAALVWTGLRLSMVSSMLRAVVTVIGIAMVVHVIVWFRQARNRGQSPREALSLAGGLLVAPIFWTAATDAVGFASLMVARAGPVRDFGLMMAVGSLLTLLSIAVLLPALALLGRVDPDPKRAWGEGLLDANLRWIIGWVRRRPRTVGLAVLFLAGAAGAGVHRLEVETDFTTNFRSGSVIVRSYQFVEDHLGGAGVWDVIVPAPKHLDWQYLRRVRRLEDRLRREVSVRGADGKRAPGLTKVLSLADAVRAGAATDPGRIRPASLRNAVIAAGLKRMTNRMPVFMRALHGEDPQQPGRYYLRIMLRARERQPAAQKRQLIQRVEQISREEFPPATDAPGAEVTGFFVLLTNLIASTLRDQWLAFGLATAGIGLMMVVALRSVVLAVVALLPNVLPILLVTGLMGWLGMKINMGAAMIAAVSMGLSIDSSIHYITAFRRIRGEGKSLDETLATVQQSVGRAMVFSTLALIVGFTVLRTSQFVPTIYFGVLVSLSMLGGLLGNLIVLPLLLRLVTREAGG
jgi:predicted RND superfamily exporter protein